MIGILVAALAYFSAAGGWPTRFVDLPHLRRGTFDWAGLFVAPSAASWNAVMAYSLVMVFDIGGAMFGLGNLAGIVKDGHIPGATRAYLAACAGTALGAYIGARRGRVGPGRALQRCTCPSCQRQSSGSPGAGCPCAPAVSSRVGSLAASCPLLLAGLTFSSPSPQFKLPAGTTPVIIAAESAVGIKEGGRTGLVAVTVAACFGLSIFFAPFLQSIPQVRAADWPCQRGDCQGVVPIGARMLRWTHFGNEAAACRSWGRKWERGRKLLPAAPASPGVAAVGVLQALLRPTRSLQPCPAGRDGACAGACRRDDDG